MEKQLKRTIDQWKYLAFSSGREHRGIAILKVKEIADLVPVTYMPGLPACMEGVVNLRGRFVPVVDIRQKRNMPGASYTEMTCIIVIEMQAGKGMVAEVGIIVDAVSEVVNIRKKAARPGLLLVKKEPGMTF